GSTIKRSSYALAGQVVAFRVAGDPVATNNGLFFIYGDHLGSTSVLQKSGEAQHLAGSLARYRPFGSYRTAPTQTITDRDFTGQRENRELGLLYYNARFYHPASGRFISPDFLVPSPSDPQSLNRYSYVRNSPLSRVDPTGHVDCGLLGEASDMRSCKSSKRNELSQRLAKVAYDDPLVRHSRLSQNEIASNISLILEKGESYDLTASQMAYVLTTAQAETHMGFWMYEAIGEETANKKYGPGSPNSTILGNTQPGDGYKYRGRGFVQLTGRANYTARGYAENPDAVADPAVAVHLLLGITTSRLDGYTDENGHVDYYNARDLVNGDKDDKKFGNAYTGTVGEYFMETAPLFEALLVEYGYGSNE
ncbi:MAG: hypothetical protein KDE56_05435, partial [Anaerolineales bacterium]|nr:hypothetical protein [Anaerolineales bacterium]